MRILLDTNIFIEREDNKPLNNDLQTLLNLLNKASMTILVHPKSIEELNNDKDKNRRDIEDFE